MESDIKSSDFFIFTVRTYASPYMMKMGLDYGPARIQHCEVAEKYTKFKEDLFDTFSDKSYKQIVKEHIDSGKGFFMFDDMKEVLKYKHDVFSFDGGAFTQFVIPKDKTEEIEK